MCDREPGVELQVGPVDPDELLEIDKGNQTLAQVDLAVGDTEPAPQMLEHAGRDRAGDLEADDVAEAAPAHFQLDRLEQIVRLVGDLEVRVSGDAKGAALDGLHIREEPPQEMADDALERDEEPAASDREKARQRLGHLDARESLLARLRIAHEDGKAERESRDVRERLPRADCERRQHREDLALEELFQLGQLLAVAVVDVADDHAGLSERRTKVPLPELGLCRAQLLRAVPNLGQRFLRRAPVGRANGESRLHLAHEPRDPHHEELVQVGREVRAVARPFEQGQSRIGSLVEYAGVVVEPGKLAVERPLRDLGFCRN